MYIHTRLFIVEDVFNEYIPLQMHECYLVISRNVRNSAFLFLMLQKLMGLTTRMLLSLFLVAGIHLSVLFGFGVDAIRG